jgi:hypothetical protein
MGGFYPDLRRRRKHSQVLEGVRIESCGDKVQQIQLLGRVSKLNASAALELQSGRLPSYHILSLPSPYRTSQTPPIGTSITASVPSFHICLQFIFSALLRLMPHVPIPPCAAPPVAATLPARPKLPVDLLLPPFLTRPFESRTAIFAASSTMHSTLSSGRVKYSTLYDNRAT